MGDTPNASAKPPNNVVSFEHHRRTREAAQRGMSLDAYDLGEVLVDGMLLSVLLELNREPLKTEPPPDPDFDRIAQAYVDNLNRNVLLGVKPPDFSTLRPPSPEFRKSVQAMVDALNEASINGTMPDVP